MQLDKFIEAIGTPEEWASTPPTYPRGEIVLIDTVTTEFDVNGQKKIIGSVATKQEVDLALKQL